MINFGMTMQIAYRALKRNKMRSFLTMLGIIIGVASVITMIAVGEGAKQTIESSIASMGTNILFIMPGSFSQGGAFMGRSSGTSLTDDDATAILQECPAVRYVSPTVQTGGQVVYSNLNWNTSVSGVSPDYLSIRDWKLGSGEFFTDQDIRAKSKVCVLGKTVVDNLFTDGQDPVGSIIRIKKVPFRVIGVLESRGQTGFGQDQDDTIIIPYSTAQVRLAGRSRFMTIIVSAVSPSLMSEAQKQITELLRQRHRIQPGQEDDFSIRNQTDITNMATSATQVMTLLLGSIASVSLLVGGIGIMNIMLVSVTERTREIGIRMAIGAKEQDIMLQFLTEAIVLSVLGGTIGILLGMGLAILVSMIAKWNTNVSLMSIILSFCFSMAVGVFFGFQPARKASKLNPIEALRYE